MVYIILAIVVVLLLIYISLYNSLVRLRNRSEEAEAQIGAHEKQRYDLIPNLVETVKGYAAHEKGTLEAVVAARNKAISSTGISESDASNKELSNALGKLFALAEAYPQLKANENFMNLQQTLSAVEEKILNARKYYNAVVREFNTRCETFPSNLAASMGHFSKKPYLEIEEAAKQNVKVSF
jgi:LemA protein